jgi:hypothetical protein
MDRVHHGAKATPAVGPIDRAAAYRFTLAQGSTPQKRCYACIEAALPTEAMCRELARLRVLSLVRHGTRAVLQLASRIHLVSSKFYEPYFGFRFDAVFPREGHHAATTAVDRMGASAPIERAV